MTTRTTNIAGLDIVVHTTRIKAARNFFSVDVLYLTNEQVKVIDEDLPETGSSQESGWYWQETDGNEFCSICGPYPTQQAALKNAEEFIQGGARS